MEPNYNSQVFCPRKIQSYLPIVAICISMLYIRKEFPINMSYPVPESLFVLGAPVSLVSVSTQTSATSYKLTVQKIILIFTPSFWTCSILLFVNSRALCRHCWLIQPQCFCVRRKMKGEVYIKQMTGLHQTNDNQLLQKDTNRLMYLLRQNSNWNHQSTSRTTMIYWLFPSILMTWC